MSEIARILERAAERLSKPGVWGQSCGPTHGFHCAATAIAAETYGEATAIAYFAEHIGVPPVRKAIWRWNDDPSRTLDDVLTALREAANLAREQSK